ncbi:membrane protein YpdK [Klebsiella pneumoniae]
MKYFFMGLSFMVIVWARYFCPDDLDCSGVKKNGSLHAPVFILPYCPQR